METTACESLTIRCDACGLSSITVHGGRLEALEHLARASGWTDGLGLWSCVLCSQVGRLPAGVEDVRVRLAE